jgi:hypothetical protein
LSNIHEELFVKRIFAVVVDGPFSGKVEIFYSREFKERISILTMECT